MSRSHKSLDKDLQGILYKDTQENPGYLLGRHGPALLENASSGVSTSRPAIIMVPGDGNCGFYSIALGLLNLIAQDKMALAAKDYTRFFNLIRESGAGKPLSVLKSRLQYYKDGFPGNGPDKKRARLDAGCIASIEEIIAAIEGNRLTTFDQFKQFVNTHTSYYQILALAISLAPALRALSVDLYEHEYRPLVRDSNFGDVVAPPKARDGEYTAPDQLNLLAGFFNFHFISFDVRGNPIMMGASYGSVRPLPSRDNLIEAESLSIQPITSQSAGNVAVEEVKAEIELDPLLGLPVASSSSINNATPVVTDVTAKKQTPNPTLPDVKPTIKLIYLEAAMHWELLLPEGELQSPPFYFGFDLARVPFSFDFPPKLSIDETNHLGLKYVENKIMTNPSIPTDQKKAQLERALKQEKARQEKEKQQELQRQQIITELKEFRTIQHGMGIAKGQFQQQTAERQQLLRSLPNQRLKIESFKRQLASLKTAINKIPSGKEREYGLKAITALETDLPKLCITSDAQPDQIGEKQEAFTRCQLTITQAQTHYSTSRLSIAAGFANLGLLLLGILPYMAAAAWHYHKTGKIGFFHSPEPALKGGELPRLSTTLNNLNWDAPREQLQPK